MHIYGYQQEGFSVRLIPIEAVPSKKPFTILGLSPAKQTMLKKLLRLHLPILPPMLVQIPAWASVQQVVAGLLLLLLSSEKGILNLCDHAVLVAGTLSLEGSLLPCTSTYAFASLCKQHRLSLILGNFATESSVSAQLSYCTTIQQALSRLCRFAWEHQGKPDPYRKEASPETPNDPFRGIIGLYRAKQALVYAVAGNLPILFYGPPGSGKSLLLGRIEELLPPPVGIEAEQLQGILGKHRKNAYALRMDPMQRPKDFEQGTPPWMARAHGGALLVDELSSQRPGSRTYLARLLDTQEVLGYPVRTLVAAATNACPCAKLGSTEAVCRCSEQQIDRFWSTLGSPLLDRFAIAIALEPENLLISTLASEPLGLDRIASVRSLQRTWTDEEPKRLLALYRRTVTETHTSLRRAILCCKLAKVIAAFSQEGVVTQEIMKQANTLYQLPKDRHYH